MRAINDRISPVMARHIGVARGHLLEISAPCECAGRYRSSLGRGHRSAIFRSAGNGDGTARATGASMARLKALKDKARGGDHEVAAPVRAPIAEAESGNENQEPWWH
jgi:hypothetical protein